MNLKLILSLILLIPVYAFPYKYEKINVDLGLSNMIVRSTTQDRNKLLWFATNSGIQSFDGTNFRDYNIKNMIGSTNSDNRFSHIVEGNRGEIYASNRSNLFWYNRLLDRFEALFPDEDKKEIIINNIDVVSGKDVYISTTTGLFHLGDKNKIIPISINAECFGVAATKQTTYVASTLGLLSLKGKTEWTKNKENIINSTPVGFIHADSRSNIWIQHKNGDVRIMTSLGNYITPEWNKILLKKPVRSLIEYNGSYIVAVDGLGLLFCDNDFALTSIDKPIDGDNTSLNTDGIYHLYKDVDNYLWISTFMGGLNYINPNSLGFVYFKHKDNHINSLSNNNVRAVTEHSDGTLWFGNKNGISVFNPVSQQWRHKTNLPSNTVLALCEDLNNNIWVSAFSSGVIICDQSLKTISTINRDNSEISSNDIFAIFRDSDSNMWLSGEDGTVSLVKMPSMEVVKYSINNIVREIRELRTGNIVVVGSGGIHIIDRLSTVVKRIYPSEGSTSHVAMLYSLVEDPSGDLWVASEGDGLIRISPEGEVVEQITVDDGLLSNVVYGIEKAGEDLWVSTDKGLSRYGLLSHKLTNFSKRTGLGMNGFIYCCHTSLHNKDLIFGGLDGAVLFPPKDIKYAYSSRPLIFTGVKIFDREIIPGDNSPLKKAINEADRLKLKYHENSISISFTSVTPVNDIHNEYEWQLEGVDSEWSKPTNNQIASYNNLSHGKYLFKVRTINHGRKQSSQERTLEIIISPPWWQTFWAYSIYIIVLFAILLLGTTYIKGMIVAQVNANKVKIFTGIAHDIKTPLSIIKLLLSNIKTRISDQESIQEIAIAIKQSDHLAVLASQLIEVEKVTKNEAPKSKIAKYRVEASIEGISYAFSSLMEHKSIQLKLEIPETPTWVWFDMDMFQKVIYNIIDNAVKYTPPGGIIIISTQKDSKWCHIRISDTGIGIPNTEKGNILKRYFRATNAANMTDSGSGIGLMLVKSLVRNMRGKISFTSEENIGTTFHLQLPLGKGHITEKDQIIDSFTKPVQLSENGKHRILLVEDNIELRETITRKLSTIYNVDVAGDGIEALDCIKKAIPDVIVTDYMMPNMNGIELSRMIKLEKDYCGIPLIMLTALSSNEHKVEGFNAGVDSYIEKPFDINVILSRIENLIYNRTLIANKNKIEKAGTQEAETSESRLLKLFETYVIEHLSDYDFSVEDICSQMGVGYTTFYRKVKAITGKTPVDIITELRLKKANEYLETGEYTISQIGYMTGFSSPSYFTKVYKKYFGKTPNQSSRSRNSM